ncbi:hypothetical protein NGM33_09205 [Nocardiopsis dassonvillei]|uniref:hypothetical protein n=1 Tax=Nocardiopsis dassonvillei TaxID=2014 RepID=UPI0020A4D37A|nr:hypothetical protein [Nocardiopsis dassonvillei]MCP3013511.1 hypothetical protein [Nocardiopsis dassonvillei]
MAVDNPHESPKGRSFLDDYQDIENTGPEGSSAPTKGATEELMRRLRFGNPHPLKEQLREEYEKSVQREKEDDFWERERALKLVSAYFDPTPQEKAECFAQAKRERNARVEKRIEELRIQREEAYLRNVRANDSTAGKLRRLLESVRKKGERNATDLIVWQELARTVEATRGIRIPTLDEILESREYNDDPLAGIFEERPRGY